MQIEVISVNTNSVPTAKGGYQIAEVAYKNLADGKVTGKKIMSFANKDVFKIVTSAKAGDVFDVTTEKDDKGYWQWKSLNSSTGAVSGPKAGGFTSPRSTYETPEERKQRQDFIIRQSSLSSAIAALKTEKNSPTFEEVAALAEKFVAFVYNKPDNVFADMEDDIPL